MAAGDELKIGKIAANTDSYGMAQELEAVLLPCQIPTIIVSGLIKPIITLVSLDLQLKEQPSQLAVN